jgi:hypothetical protein
LILPFRGHSLPEVLDFFPLTDLNGYSYPGRQGDGLQEAAASRQTDGRIANIS